MSYKDLIKVSLSQNNKRSLKITRGASSKRFRPAKTMTVSAIKNNLKTRLSSGYLKSHGAYIF